VLGFRPYKPTQRRIPLPRLVRLCCCALFVLGASSTSGQTKDPVSELLRIHQQDLSVDGKAFLLQEANRASFLLIGGLHGDNDTQALMQDLASRLQPTGYHHIAVEMSPWAAARIEATMKTGAGVLWGSDIEETQPNLVIRELATANPQNSSLQSMSEMTEAGYRRSLAPDLLRLLRQTTDLKDVSAGGVSLRSLLLKTLEVEVDRLNAGSRLAASVRRETVMKDLFLTHYRSASNGDVKPKVIVVFGQNHLHRGYDLRGVSTLGNFIAELALANGAESFHVALFAAGGKISLGGLHDADQRKDEAAFEILATAARYPATVFDLRPLRQTLHDIPPDKLSASEANLSYWADSYDAIICYREVTPFGIAR
jgi:hypothetical protein